MVNNIKKQLNACIREGLEVTDLIQEGIAITNEVDVNVIRLWKLIESIKLELFHYILVEDSIGCEIAEKMMLTTRDMYLKTNLVHSRL